jgi:hypothetical protein
MIFHGLNHMYKELENQIIMVKILPKPSHEEIIRMNEMNPNQGCQYYDTIRQCIDSECEHVIFPPNTGPEDVIHPEFFPAGVRHPPPNLKDRLNAVQYILDEGKKDQSVNTLDSSDEENEFFLEPLIPTPTKIKTPAAPKKKKQVSILKNYSGNGTKNAPFDLTSNRKIIKFPYNGSK